MKIKFSKEQKLKALKLYEAGNSIKEVSFLTGISTSYIKNLLKKFNILTRPSGFQIGNFGRTNKPHSIETKEKISKAHKKSGHTPSAEAIAKGQPLTLKVRWKNHNKDPIRCLMRSYYKGAIKRNLCFELSREEFEILILKNCYYCDDPPSLRLINNTPLICNGIDRVDNSIGYLIENCVPACKICNVMKSSKNRDDFINHCRKIVKRNFVNE